MILDSQDNVLQQLIPDQLKCMWVLIAKSAIEPSKYTFYPEALKECNADWQTAYIIIYYTVLL